MRKKAGSVCMMLGLLLLTASIALMAYNSWDNYRAGRTAAEIQSALESAIRDNRENTADTPAVGGDMKSLPETTADTGMGTLEIDGYEYIGILTIPSLNLELPIMSEWSYAGMKISPGRYAGSIRTDDLVICGHNYTGHFGNLKYLESGKEVSFTDIKGNVFYYEVLEVIILQSKDVEEMISREEEWDMTLFTCTADGQARVAVRLSRIE